LQRRLQPFFASGFNALWERHERRNTRNPNLLAAFFGCYIAAW